MPDPFISKVHTFNYHACCLPARKTHWLQNLCFSCCPVILILTVHPFQKHQTSNPHPFLHLQAQHLEASLLLDREIPPQCIVDCFSLFTQMKSDHRKVNINLCVLFCFFLNQPLLLIKVQEEESRNYELDGIGGSSEGVGLEMVKEGNPDSWSHWRADSKGSSWLPLAQK